MNLDDASCYRALATHDRRFDGAFFVGVSTTGIYCRPICPVRTPRRDRCTFFQRAAEAEKAGFRACFRCRPELAPGHAQVDSVPRLVRAAAERIDAGELDESSVDELAQKLGVTGRHLRRAMEAELGVSPIEYAQTRRLALAKQLLHDTPLGLAEVAFAAGFSSVRRFNALFRERFGMAPSAVRRGGATPTRAAKEAGTFTLRLDYRPPLAWEHLVGFLAGRAIPGVEHVHDGMYERTVKLGDDVGTVRVQPGTGKAPTLLATVSLSLLPRLPALVARLRRLFDLDADPARIAAVLRVDPALRDVLKRVPGLRVPGAFEPFEMSVRAVLGQQVTVKGATTLSGRFARAFGTPLPDADLEADAPLSLLFPSAAAIAVRTSEEVQAIGLPTARARTLLAMAAALSRADHPLELSPSADPTETIAALEELPGVGPWTASYLAMRALHWPDAFPAGDLGIRQAMETKSDREAIARAEAWRPFRAYAAMYLWTKRSQA